MNKQEFLEQKSIVRLLDGLRSRRSGNPAESTEKAFLSYIIRYCKFYGKVTDRGFVAPDIIMQERKEDLHSTDEDVIHRHEDFMKQFKNLLSQEEKCGSCRAFAVDPKTLVCANCGKKAKELTGEKGSSGRVAYAFHAVQALYRENYKELQNVHAPAINTLTQYKVPTQEEWRNLVLPVLEDMTENGDPLAKELNAYIFAAKDCGMAPAELLSLTGRETTPGHGTVLEQLRRGDVPVHVRLVKGRQKTEGKAVGWFQSFLGPESSEVLQKYLKPRPQHLFTMAPRTVEQRFMLLTRNINREIMRLQKKGEPVPYWSNFTPKCCRKFFTAQYKFAKVSLKEEYVMAGNMIVEFMAGHSVKKQEMPYLIEKFRDHPDDLAEIYMSGYDSVRFYPKAVS